MSKVYTESEIKSLVLTEINTIQKLTELSITFAAGDATLAYDAAVREVGFEVPVATDDDLDLKNEWLIKRMRYYFYFQLRQKLLLMVESGDLKGGGSVERITRILDEWDKKFEQIKELDPWVFTSSENIYGDMSLVIPSGFKTDRIGQDTTQYSTDEW